MIGLQEGIIPAWEDDANKNGGKWSIQLPKEKNRKEVDRMWLYTVRLLTAGHRICPKYEFRCSLPLVKRLIQL